MIRHLETGLILSRKIGKYDIPIISGVTQNLLILTILCSKVYFFLSSSRLLILQPCYSKAFNGLTVLILISRIPHQDPVLLLQIYYKVLTFMISNIIAKFPLMNIFKKWIPALKGFFHPIFIPLNPTHIQGHLQMLLFIIHPSLIFPIDLLENPTLFA